MIVLRCLHGFLGSPRDFEPIEAGLRARGFDVTVEAPRLFELADLSMPACVDHLWSQCQPQDVLLGYSMGGRLAMQVFAKRPQRARALVVVSANAGGLTAEQSRARIADDEKWAHRFETDPWDQLLRDWNGQGAFGGIGSRFSRKQEDYDRMALAGALRNWSVGRQPEMLQELAHERRPILWLAGGQDTKYSTKAREAKERIPALTLRIVEKAGHRVPWENTASFLDHLAAFLTSIEGMKG